MNVLTAEGKHKRLLVQTGFLFTNAENVELNTAISAVQDPGKNAQSVAQLITLITIRYIQCKLENY